MGDYTTNTSGRIVIASLAAGTYNITETKAPSHGDVPDIIQLHVAVRHGSLIDIIHYNKDEVPKTIEVKIGETTEVTWALRGHKGQVTIDTTSHCRQA